MIFFGLGVWRGLPELATKDDLRKLFEQFERKIMPTQAEIVVLVNQCNEALTDVATEVSKVAAETDGLQERIADLEAAVNNQNEASPELVAAVTALKAQAIVVADGVKAVDDKVPDAVTPVAPPTS
jgi:chromosome segregation ATPase